MIQYERTQFATLKTEEYFSYDDVLSDKLNFNVAFGLTEYDGSSEIVEDENYGTIKAYYRGWTDIVKGQTRYEKLLETRQCSL